MSQFSTIVLFLGLLIPYMVFASECGPNGEFTSCGNSCSSSCDNIINKSGKECTAVCVPGCKCNKPYILKDGQCVLPSQC